MVPPVEASFFQDSFRIRLSPDRNSSFLSGFGEACEEDEKKRKNTNFQTGRMVKK